MTARRPIAFVAVIAATMAAPAPAQNDSGPESARPIAIWRFEGQDPGARQAAGNEAGPRPPIYPGFAATNRAQRFAGTGLTFAEKDLGGANLRFGAGDAITIEAWVKVEELKSGSYSYLVGKGRTRATGFPEKNQNYALRLFGKGSEARLSFLFASAAEKGKDSEWHRWTSGSGFAWGDGWHHVAVTYVFGRPNSILGLVDGRAAKGTWDMGGATTRAPVSDGDAVQLGTGNGGGAGNVFRGLLDDVSITRAAVGEEALGGKYQYVPPPPAVVAADLPSGRVLVQLFENGFPDRNAWPAPTPPSETIHE
ncbi:MAG TPA: LamG-like jellyroll fold domain-containing protein, partial [Planctomycetia bacterium]|nr:LamG-like jellyroll fold domain-containing protein [Planctomycetia bacterium]